MVGQVCLRITLLVLFGMTVIFIRLVSLFVAYIASSFEALILAFLVLTFVPLSGLLPLQAFGSKCFPLRVFDHIGLDFIGILVASFLRFMLSSSI